MRDAGAVEQIVRWIPIEPELIGVAKDCLVSVGRGPDGDPSRAPSLQGAPAHSHGSGGDAPVRNKGRVDAQGFIDRGRQKRWLLSKLSLEWEALSQVMHQNTDACGNGSQLAHRPVPDDTDDFLVA